MKTYVKPEIVLHQKVVFEHFTNPSGKGHDGGGNHDHPGNPGYPGHPGGGGGGGGGGKGGGSDWDLGWPW